MSDLIMGREFAKALEEAGVVSDLNTIERIVIDVRWERVDVHVKRTGDKRLLDVAALLAGDERHGVRYWVLVSHALLDDARPWEDVGLRLVERGAWEGTYARWCLFEDPEAPAELEGKQVELTISRGRAAEDGPGLPPHITGRQVTG